MDVWQKRNFFFFFRNTQKRSSNLFFCKINGKKNINVKTFCVTVHDSAFEMHTFRKLYVEIFMKNIYQANLEWESLEPFLFSKCKRLYSIFVN